MGVQLIGAQQGAHGVGLIAGHDHQQLLGTHDVAHAHGDGVAGHIVTAGEEAGVGVDGGGVQGLLVGAVHQHVAGLIEAQVAVGAYAQHLHVDVGLVQDGVELTEVLLHVAHALGHVGVGLVDVDMVEQVIVHEVAIALVVVAGEAHILIQIDAVDAGEVQTLLMAAAAQLLIHAHGAGAGGKAQGAIGLGADDGLDDVCAQTAGLGVILGDDDFHGIIPIPRSGGLSMIFGASALGDDVLLIFIDMGGGDDAADAGGGVDIAVAAYHGAGVEDAVAAHLHPVAQHGAYLLAAGGDQLVAVLDEHGQLVGLDVAGDGAGAHVGLIAQNGVAYIIIMGHLHVVEEDHVLQLGGVAHHAVVAHQGAAPDEGALAHLGAVADDAGAVDIGGGEDGGVLGDPHVGGGVVILRLAEGGAQGQDQVGDAGERLPGIGELLQIFACRRVGQVIHILNMPHDLLHLDQMSGGRHGGDDGVHVGLALGVGAGLGHDPQHRLGAALAEQDPAVIAQAGGAFLHRLLHGGIGQRAVLIVHADVFQHLGVHGDVLGQHAEGQLGGHHHVHQHDGGEETVAGVGELAEDHMAGRLAADEVVVLLHVLVDIAVAHGGLFIADAQTVQRLIQAEVGHDGGDHGVGGELAPLLHVAGHDEHDLVAVHHLAPLIHRKAAVGIAVEGEAHVHVVLTDILLQALDVGGAAAGIDVDAVGLGVDDAGLGPQGVEHGAADHPGAAVGAVQRHLALVEGAGGQAGEVADVAVAAGIEVHGAADFILGGPGNLGQVAVDVALDLVLEGIVHLLALAVHQLDAVVIIGIMAGGDHHAAVEALGAGDVADAGGGGDVEQVGIAAGGGDACGQGGLVHVGGTTGILADDDAGLVASVKGGVMVAQETTGEEGVAGRQVNAGLAPEAVSAEIFAHGNTLLIDPLCGTAGAVARRAALFRSRFFLFCGRPHICKAVSHGRTPRENTRRMFDNRGRPPQQRRGMRRKLSSSSSRLPAIRRGRWRYVRCENRKPPFTATGFYRVIIAPSYKLFKIWGDNSWGGADEGVGWAAGASVAIAVWRWYTVDGGGMGEMMTGAI